MAKTSGSLRGGSLQGGNSDVTPVEAFAKISKVIADIQSKGYSSEQPFSIGEVDSEMKDYAKENDIALASDDIYMSSAQIRHTLRDSKVESGKAISASHLEEFPMRRSSMELYHDESNGNFIYYDREREEKFVIHPNYSMKISKKKTATVNYITASKTDHTEFMMGKYTRIK